MAVMDELRGRAAQLMGGLRVRGTLAERLRELRGRIQESHNTLRMLDHRLSDAYGGSDEELIQQLRTQRERLLTEIATLTRDEEPLAAAARQQRYTTLIDGLPEEMESVRARLLEHTQELEGAARTLQRAVQGFEVTEREYQMIAHRHRELQNAHHFGGAPEPPAFFDLQEVMGLAWRSGRFIGASSDLLSRAKAVAKALVHLDAQRSNFGNPPASTAARRRAAAG